MRKIARLIGIAWMAAAFAAVLIVGFIELFFNGGTGLIIPIPGGFGEVYVIAALALPGYGLYAWGSPKPSTPHIE